jgi:hypothetical protein
MTSSLENFNLVYFEITTRECEIQSKIGIVITMILHNAR